ncbi:kanamycin nucleotidyltransferase C-terminal domain-containing protein [Alteribacter natronophilus]|uniref:kanamycin nucleotidyltransferase C-terminal domain-containing protein n=1 Tax=Alteribacter natronophilus TaxID=2583810 RepID=UPI001FE919A6|nr:kanamycin nucleotidyltransferase C-terminal domain-containing protein [Alteribacter natronophilus]
MPDIVTFADENLYREKASEIAKRHEKLIKSILPAALIYHIGSTAVPGSLTKGDVDLQVRVSQRDFPEAKEALARHYKINEGSFQSSCFCAFEKEDELLPLGVQLTVISSEVDHFWKLTAFLQTHPEFNEQYNALKQSAEGLDMDEYRNRKARFIEEILDSDPYRRFSFRLEGKEVEPINPVKRQKERLSFPKASTRKEKSEMIEVISRRLLDRFGKDITAVGVYGSVGQESEGPFSDIEIHVVTKEGKTIQEYEFIYGGFKIELSTAQETELLEKACRVDDSWPIRAGAYVHVKPLYDPDGFFDELQKTVQNIKYEEVKTVMREFMIWEPYETMGKIRNNYASGNHRYLPLAAKDLAYQTAKLIGLANRRYYRTRARMFEDSLSFPSRPEGYERLLELLLEGQLHPSHKVYDRCENLWTGLNIWFEELGIDYQEDQLPF